MPGETAKNKHEKAVEKKIAGFKLKDLKSEIARLTYQVMFCLGFLIEKIQTEGAENEDEQKLQRKAEKFKEAIIEFFNED